MYGTLEGFPSIIHVLIARLKVLKESIAVMKFYSIFRSDVANGKQGLHKTMEEWNGLFIKHGLKRNLEKTEVLHIGHQRGKLDMELEGKKLNQFRVPRRRSVRRREDGERGTSKSTGRSERMESS